MVLLSIFCLMNVQYQAGLVGFSISNDAMAQSTMTYDQYQQQQQNGGEPLKADQVYSGEDAENAGGYLDQILYLAIGLIAGTMIIKATGPIPADVIVAAVAGGILLVGEFMMMSKKEDAVAALELHYTSDNEGKTYDNAQTEALKTQLKMNEDLKEALETKRNIQMAATAALIGASLTAIVIEATGEATSTTGAASAAVPGSVPPTPVTPNPFYNPLCIPSLSTLFPTYKTTKITVRTPSMTKVTTLTTTCTSMALCTFFLPYCTYEKTVNYYMKRTGTVTQNLDSGWKNLFQKFAEANPEGFQIAQNFMNDIGIESAEEKRKKYIEESAYKLSHGSIIPSSHSIQGLHASMNKANKEIKEKDPLKRYINVYERNKLASGSNKSMSLEEYKRFSQVYGYESLSETDQSTMKDILVTAADKGLDLIIPEAEAGWMGLLSMVGGVLIGVFMAQDLILDTFFDAGYNRAIAWGIMGVIVGYGLTQTMKGIDATESNINKLNDILNKMSHLEDGVAVNGQGNGGVNGNDQNNPNITGNSDQQNVDLGLEDGQKTPCVGGTMENGTCKKIGPQLQQADAAGNLNLGSALAGTANLIGQVGDGISGTDKISGSTLNAMSQLGSKKGALASNRRAALAKLENMLKQNKAKPFGYNRRVSDLHKKMRSALKKSLKKQGLTPKAALAKMGMPVADPGKGIEKGDLEDKGELLAKAGPAVVVNPGAGAKAGKIDFGFGKLDDKSMAAQGAGGEEGMADANVVGEDEEYVLDDIAEDKNASIFQIISVRYLKSGYKRLQNQKKTPKVLQ